MHLYLFGQHNISPMCRWLSQDILAHFTDPSGPLYVACPLVKWVTHSRHHKWRYQPQSSRRISVDAILNEAHSPVLPKQSLRLKPFLSVWEINLKTYPQEIPGPTTRVHRGGWPGTRHLEYCSHTRQCWANIYDLLATGENWQLIMIAFQYDQQNVTNNAGQVFKTRNIWHKKLQQLTTG